MLTGKIKLPPVDRFAIPAVTARQLTIVKGRETPHGFERGETLPAELVKLVNVTPPGLPEDATFGPCQAGEFYIVEVRDCANAKEPPERPTHAGAFFVDAHVAGQPRVVGAGHLDVWFE